ncbi:MAG: transposase [Sedimentisphaerales bacterium]|nr:transposase [Sedimentisphaerales bacterium]
MPHGPHAKPGPSRYRRNLPHLQADNKTIFLTFCTKDRWILPEPIRTQVLHHCLHDHGTKIHVHGVVVMPDHGHMIFTPLRDPAGYPYTLAEVTNAIKGASAHSINRSLRREGPVWQDESFDHVLRRDEAVSAKVAYICANPIRKGLCRTGDEYEWLWREWIEGAM